VPLAATGPDDPPFPRLSFQVPEAASGATAPPLVVEVEGVGGAGGTYGLRLREQPASAAPRADEPREPPPAPPATRGPLPEVPNGFAAAPGDVAVLFLPKMVPVPHVLQVREGEAWVALPQEAKSPWGERASVTTPELRSLVAFRAHRSGEYRFVPHAAAGKPILHTVPAEHAGSGPLLLGGPSDPTIFARSANAWRSIGVAVVAPGGDYLFVAAGGGARHVSMRVRSADGKDLARRTGSEFAATEVAGVGPSLRFRVKEPQAVRLEVSGPGWRGYALLRRASN
jgi:hypothetical protein